jgi:predicted amidohydrolase YtcJ
MHLRLDLILENADVLTMDPRRPRARRIGVLHGRVVGLDEELEGHDAVERIDVEGACVLPGFIDAHTHLELTGQSLSAVDITACATPEAALAVIAEAARGTTAGEWLDVTGYDQARLGRHLTAQELDRAAHGRKVWVRQISSHASVVSRAVLDALEPALLSHPDAASGLFKELDQNTVLQQRLPYSMEDVGTLVVLAAEQARREGITTCVDAGNGGAVGSLSPVDGAAYLSALERGVLPVRMQLMPSADVLSELATHQDDGFRRGLPLGIRSGFGSDWLGIAAQKIVLDGGMQVETARMSQPYAGGDNVGIWREDPQEMVEATVDGHRAGWQMALHAIGDAAVDLAIEAFEKAQATWPRADARHRIEHGGVIRDDQLARLAALDVTVVSQPSFVYDFGDRYVDQLGPERAPWLYRGRSLLDAGVRLVGSTDRPLPGDPLRAVQTLAERRTRTGQLVAPEERISVRAALESFTVHAAWALRREDRLGRIAPRQLADLAVLEHNPLQVDVSGIADIRVLGTAVDGRLWWASGDAPCLESAPKAGR